MRTVRPHSLVGLRGSGVGFFGAGILPGALASMASWRPWREPGGLLPIVLDLDGYRATITIENQGRGNALSTAMMLDLAAALGEAAAARVRVAVLKGGGGKAFCSGYDLSELPNGQAEEEAPDAWDDRFPELSAMLRAFEEFPAPLIAQMNGHAIGGGALVTAACDFRLAQEEARFHIPATRLGVLYPLEGLRRLVALVGLAHTSEILILGDPISAQRGLVMGLFNEVAPVDDLPGRVDALAASIEQRAPLTVAALRAILRAEALQQGDAAIRALHHDWTTRCLGSGDLAEGLRAAAERRPPVFRGQ